MWSKIAAFIIRNRIALLVLIAAITAVMGYFAMQARLSYQFSEIVPPTDADYRAYESFKEQFGENDQSSLVIGFRSRSLFQQEFFSNYYDLVQSLEKVTGVDRVLALTNVPTLEPDRTEKRFVMDSLISRRPETQDEVDSLRQRIEDLPFYKGLLWNPSTRATIMVVELDLDVFQSTGRNNLLDSVTTLTEKFAEESQVNMHYSGLPYIRAAMSNKVKDELQFFSVLAIIVTSIILLIFFRSFAVVIFPLIVICIIIVWVLGTIAILDYRINVLTGLIPPLIVIITVPNFIYFLNKYHSEFKKHGNKLKAIERMVEKIGIIAFLTNTTTAIGFGVLAFTDSPILQHFGIVASLNILATFFVSIILVPVVFSYMPEPSSRHTNYLNNKLMHRVLATIDYWVHHRRKEIYLITAVVFIAAVAGMFRLQAVGYMLDDIPKHDKLAKDLKFFEDHFGGVMPFEIIIDTRKPKSLMQPEMLQKIAAVEDTLAQYDELSRPLSIVDFVKFSRQAYYNGTAEDYQLPGGRERMFIMPYLMRSNTGGSITSSMVDSNNQVARISVNMADIGSQRLKVLKDEIRDKLNTIFTEEEAEVTLTGVSVVFLKNNKYLINSLVSSLILAFVIIAFILGILFRDWKMILISVLPNVLPLLVTAGLMGHFGIAIKPSTVLVFSIAFGISIDDALHFLAKYRQELQLRALNFSETVSVALRETGISMVYTSVVLFFGFSIFNFSGFGGTAMLGLLTSTTLLVAMLTNLVLLPALILTFSDPKKRNKVV